MIYSFAVALIVGMIFMRYTGRDPSWVILVMTVVPDLDFVVNRIMRFFHLSSPFILNHGDFHNIISLIFFSLVASLILHKYSKMHFGDALLCAMIGFSCHLIEDFVVYTDWYGYFYPWTLREYGVAILPETRNFYGIADTKILSLGIILVCIAILIRMYFDKTFTVGNWVRKYTGIGKRMKYYTEVLMSGNSEKLEK